LKAGTQPPSLLTLGKGVRESFICVRSFIFIGYAGLINQVKSNGNIKKPPFGSLENTWAYVTMHNKK